MAEQATSRGPEPRTGTGPEQGPVSVPAAAQALGISERAVRKRIAAGTLRAEPFGRSYRVWLPQDAPLPGPEPGPAPGPDQGPEPGPEPIEAEYRARAVTVSPAAYAQIEAIRDQWLAPLVAQITEQAEQIGRLEAERDVAEQMVEEQRRRAERAEREREDLRRQAGALQAERDALRATAAPDAPSVAPAGTSGAEAPDTATGVGDALGPLRRLWRAIRGE